MPKLGMESIRRRALVEAAVLAIHEKGSLDVTVSQIAQRAGVSSALAHHYFGGKEDLIVATMRHVMALFGAHVRGRLSKAKSPRQRLSAIIAGSFTADQLQPQVMSAWLVFYALAQSSPEANRLHRIYAARLRSTLLHDLAGLAPRRRALAIAEGTAALIDGLYLRFALKPDEADAKRAVALIEDYLDCHLGGKNRA